MENRSVLSTAPNILIESNVVGSVVRRVNYPDLVNRDDMTTVPVRDIHAKKTDDNAAILTERA
jgi:hypothetical protein